MLRQPIPACERCGQETSERRRRFCSRACSDATRAGRPSPNHLWPRNGGAKVRIWKWCAVCLTPMSLPPCRAKIKVYCSRACRIDGTRALKARARYNYKGGPYPMACEVCGTIRMVRHSLRTRFRACSKSCAAAISVRLQDGRPSSIEVMMLRAFANSRLVVQPQHQVAHWRLDFAMPAHLLAIECDGDYWHSRPHQITRDARKDGWLRAHQWRVIRLSERDIRADPEACIQRVLEVMALCPRAELG